MEGGRHTTEAEKRATGVEMAATKVEAHASLRDAPALARRLGHSEPVRPLYTLNDAVIRPSRLAMAQPAR